MSHHGAVEKRLAFVPILISLTTTVVALLQVANGLAMEKAIETLIIGWLLATLVAAMVLWPLPSTVNSRVYQARGTVWFRE